MNWKTLEFDQLCARELYLIMRARSAVFVVEQSHVCLDADGRDENSLHVFAVEYMGRPMPILAYARVQSGDAKDPEITIDKVLTSPLRRGDGTAELLVEHVLLAIAERWPGHAARVSAPLGLRGFSMSSSVFARPKARISSMACRSLASRVRYTAASSCSAHAVASAIARRSSIRSRCCDFHVENNLSRIPDECGQAAFASRVR